MFEWFTRLARLTGRRWKEGAFFTSGKIYVIRMGELLKSQRVYLQTSRTTSLMHPSARLVLVGLTQAGMALFGTDPAMPEIMFGDFVTNIFDQITEQHVS